MLKRDANLLGVVGLAVADQIEQSAMEVLSRSGETPAALVVIGYDFGLSNDQLRRVLRLSHPGTVRLIDRLVADGLVERRRGEDRRAVALFLTKAGHAKRKEFLSHRIESITPFLTVLSEDEQQTLGSLLHKLLTALNPTDMERRTLCRLCDDSVCEGCPIPADFREDGTAG